MLVNSRKMLEKAKKEKVPVILGASEGAIKYMGGYDVVASLCYSLITDLEIKTDVCLHLDHGSSVESCIRAIDAGFNSVMLDMSKKPLKENIELTKEVVKYAKNNNVSVEAEIGSMGSISGKGLEIGTNTNLKDCLTFVEETGIDSVAAAVGTVHGIYRGELNIDYKLIEQLYENLNVPLVLHGGSGLDSETLRKCREAGVTKININSDLQEAWSKGVRSYLEENKDVIDPRKIIGSGVAALKEMIDIKININKDGK